MIYSLYSIIRIFLNSYHFYFLPTLLQFTPQKVYESEPLSAYRASLQRVTEMALYMKHRVPLNKFDIVLIDGSKNKFCICIALKEDINNILFIS